MKEIIVKLICLIVGILFWKLFGFEVVTISMLALIWGNTIIIEMEK